tara:strand:- start:325 stop:1206 length:882 start_codon:yes stop_codon:yes gene_type:complete
MKILFIGAVKFSEECLKKLIDLGVNVVGVCTLKESAFNSDHRNLSKICKVNNISHIYSPKINSVENLNWIRSKTPDIIFCFGWSRLLKSDLLSIPRMGVLGFHPAALPKNRGRHPLIWALVLGLNKTASTFFFMDEYADSGDILSQKIVIINDDDNAQSLYNKIIRTATKQIEEFLPKLFSGTYAKMRQDHRKANEWRKRTKRDGIIDWRMSAISIHNLVRGLSKPYVGAHFEYEGKEIKVWETEVVVCGKKNIEPGKIIGNDKSGLVIKTGHNAVRLLHTEPDLKISRGVSL